MIFDTLQFVGGLILSFGYIPQIVQIIKTNVLESKGNSNDILKEWSQKYNIHNLNVKYGNANYQRKEKDDSTTKEVLITNY